MSDAATAERRKAFGKWLKGELWRAELTQAEFARRTGATPSQVSFWVRGQRMPEPASCEAIASVLGLDVDEVLTEAGHRPAAGEADQAIRSVVSIMHRLDPAERREVEWYARCRLERSQRKQRLSAAGPDDEASGDGEAEAF